MKTKFKRALHELFIKDGISLESGIVTDIINMMAKLELKDKSESYRNGFDLSSNEYNKNEKLEFSVPQMPFKELKKLLVLFGMTEDDYTVNSSLKFKNEEFVLNTLLPQIISFYNALKQENPSFITYHQNKSKAILESTAVSTLTHYTQQAIDYLVESNATGHAELLNSILLLKGRIAQLDKHPEFYKKVA